MKRSTPRHFVTFLITGILLIGTLSCSQPNVVNIYSSRHYDSDLALFETFTEKTGIEVQIIESGGDELIERMKSEGVNSPADLLITVDAGRLWRAVEADIFQPHGSDVINQIVPVQYRDTQDLWTGLSKRVRGIVYHKDRVDPNELKGYVDLADDAWKGRICIRSSNNIYNQSLMASMIDNVGAEAAEEWAKNLVSNFARPPQGGDTDQIRAVAAGVCDLAVVNHYYLERLQTSELEEDRTVASNVGLYFPPAAHGGAHINISGAGIAKYSPNPENARVFLEFLITEEAQNLYAVRNHELPMVHVNKPSAAAEENQDPDQVASAGAMKDQLEGDGLHVSIYGLHNPEAIRIMDRAGWR